MRQILLIIILLSSVAKAQNIVNHDTILMGSRFIFTAIAPNDTIAWYAINSAKKEVIRIEKLISSWDSESETSKINQAAGQAPVKISSELFQLITRAIKVSRLTQGAFDISYAAMDRIYSFDKKNHPLPSDTTRLRAVRKIGFEKIELDANTRTAFLPIEGMKISWGAMGKGYAANQASKVMKEAGIKSGLINAGGDLFCWGEQKNGLPWRIGIADPEHPGEVKGWLGLTDMAVVTSGNYEKYFTWQGSRYAHIIDPRDGLPASGLKSVSILCPDAELADALATAVFVMGAKQGLELINKLRGIECLLITDENKILTSTHLELETSPLVSANTIIGKNE